MSVVYALICPITGYVRYVGRAENCYRRFHGHLSDARNDLGKNYLKNRWIKSLLDQSLKPILWIVFDETDGDVVDLEGELAVRLLEEGNELYNLQWHDFAKTPEEKAYIKSLLYDFGSDRGRTERHEFRVTPEVKAFLDSFVKVRGFTAADWLEQKVKEEMNRPK